MSKSNAAATLGKLLERHGGKHSENINVAMPCRVLMFDSVKLLVDVQPLIKLTGDAPAPILSVPVIGQRVLLGGVETVLRPIYRRDDTVFVVFADAEIKNTLTGQVASPDTLRKHSRNDAVVVGVLPCSL